MSVTHGMLSILAVPLLALTAPAGDWPGFRGPHSLGVGEDHALPVTWGPSENIAWKTKLPGPGSSSPITWGDRVFVTCYTGYGITKGGDAKDLRRVLLCLDRNNGEVVWQKEIETRLPETEYFGFILEHGYASSTPVTDGERVYVFFGRTGVLAFDFKGIQLWQTDVGKGLNAWGSASSPVLYNDLVLINASVESGSLFALDKRTGKQVWRAKGLRDCWSTPFLVELSDGKREVVLNTSDNLLGYDPASGDPLWQCEGVGTMTASSTPVAGNGIVYVMGAAMGGRRLLMAVRAGGRGDVSKTHVLWQQKAGANHSSPVLYRDHVYCASGIVWCLKADTGDVAYEQRLYDARQEYASPVAADGKIYIVSRRNGIFVLAATGKFEQLAHNDLDDSSGFSASPAISDGQLLVRSNAYLYCIGKRK